MQPNGTTGKDRPDIQFYIEEYGNELLRMCYLYLHDLQLAEDAVQETFIRVYEKWQDYRGDAAEKTWIIRIAINTCISMRRKRWFRDSRLSGEPRQEAAVWDAYSDDTVIRSIQSLKPALRKVVIMFYYQQMKTKEIAQCLGISESAVSVRLNRARGQLGVLLEGWYFNE